MKKVLYLFGVCSNINSFSMINRVENSKYRMYGLIGGSYLYEFSDKISVGGLFETTLTKEAFLIGVDSKISIYNRLFVFNVLGNLFTNFYNSNLVVSIKGLRQMIEVNENIFIGFNWNMFKDKTYSIAFVVMYNINYKKNIYIKLSGNFYILKKVKNIYEDVLNLDKKNENKEGEEEILDESNLTQDVGKKTQQFQKSVNEQQAKEENTQQFKDEERQQQSEEVKVVLGESIQVKDKEQDIVQDTRKDILEECDDFLVNASRSHSVNDMPNIKECDSSKVSVVDEIHIDFVIMPNQNEDDYNKYINGDKVYSEGLSTQEGSSKISPSSDSLFKIEISEISKEDCDFLSSFLNMYFERSSTNPRNMSKNEKERLSKFYDAITQYKENDPLDNIQNALKDPESSRESMQKDSFSNNTNQLYKVKDILARCFSREQFQNFNFIKKSRNK